MRTRDGATFGTHSLTQEQAAPFAIRILKEQFESYPPHKQAQVREEVRQKLRDELRSREFAARVKNDAHTRPGSALARIASEVYGVEIGD